MRCQKGDRINRREAVQAAQAAWQSRGAKSLPLLPPTCFTLYHLGNLRAIVRATVHTVSKAALRPAAAGHAASIAFNAAAGGEPRGSFTPPPVHVSARHVVAPDLSAQGIALASLRGPGAFVEVRDPIAVGVQTCFFGVRTSVEGVQTQRWGCRVPLPLARGNFGPVPGLRPGPGCWLNWTVQPVEGMEPSPSKEYLRIIISTLP